MLKDPRGIELGEIALAIGLIVVAAYAGAQLLGVNINAKLIELAGKI